jgi:hypothetical protein
MRSRPHQSRDADFMNNIGLLQLTRGELRPSKAEFGANLQNLSLQDQM